MHPHGRMPQNVVRQQQVHMSVHASYVVTQKLCTTVHDMAESSMLKHRMICMHLCGARTTRRVCLLLFTLRQTHTLARTRTRRHTGSTYVGQAGCQAHCRNHERSSRYVANSATSGGVQLVIFMSAPTDGRACSCSCVCEDASGSSSSSSVCLWGGGCMAHKRWDSWCCQQ
jgi:hypothetical protein